MLWNLAELAGWGKSDVISLNGDGVYSAVLGSDFAAYVKKYPGIDEATAAAQGADLVVCINPLPDSFFPAQVICERLHKPMMIDCDDPYIEDGLSWQHPVRRLAKEVVRHQVVATWRRIRRESAGILFTTSNPVLAQMRGGVSLPHVRGGRELAILTGDGDAQPVVSFIGVPRIYKGIKVLRAAVASIPAARRPQLLITADAPPDARPHEQWLGPVPQDEALRLIRRSAISCVPSFDWAYARAQMPLKIVDAMFARSLVVASDLPAIRWCLDDGRCGLLVRPGSVTALREALEQALDDGASAMKDAAQQHARDVFTFDAQLDTFVAACQLAAGGH